MKGYRPDPALLRFLSYVKPYRNLILLASFAGVVKYLIPLFVPWGVKVIVDEVLTKAEDAAGWAQVHGLFTVLLAAYLVWAVANFSRLYFSGLAGNRILFDLRHQLFRQLQKMPLDFFEKRRVGSVISRMMGDIQAAQQLVNQVPAVLMDLSSTLVIAALLFYIHWRLALVSLAVLPFYAALSQYFSKKIRRGSREVQQHTENLSGNLHEKFGGISVTQSFAREKEEEIKFLGEASAHLKAVLTNVRGQALGLSLTGFLASAAPLLVLWYGALQVMGGTLTVGGLVAFYAYAGLLYMPVTRLTELNVILASGLAAIDRIFEVFAVDPEIQERSNAVSIERSQGKVTFKNVNFAYPSGQTILKDLNFELNPGEIALLTGPSGSGKSTLAKLLLRFYDVSEGKILLDGLDLRDFTLSSLRRQIAFVSQEPVLFSGTILENILYGKPEAAPEAVVSAAREAQAHEFIARLPGQYETAVGERGFLLSVGEKQRIAIARAFLKAAPLLILDEPTSALDETSSIVIWESLKNLMKGRTTLLLTHHPPILEAVDRVFRLSEGTLIPEPSLYRPVARKREFLPS